MGCQGEYAGSSLRDVAFVFGPLEVDVTCLDTSPRGDTSRGLRRVR